jgi:hypothetical protein
MNIFEGIFSGLWLLHPAKPLARVRRGAGLDEGEFMAQAFITGGSGFIGDVLGRV